MSLIHVSPPLWWVIMGATVVVGIILELLFGAMVMAAIAKAAKLLIMRLKRQK